MNFKDAKTLNELTYTSIGNFSYSLIIQIVLRIQKKIKSKKSKPHNQFAKNIENNLLRLISKQIILYVSFI